jgi:hypothetical protein
MLLCEGTTVAEVESEAIDEDLTTDVANELATENTDVEMADSCDVVSGEDIIDAKQVCSVALATRIHRVLEISILPQLHKCLTKEVC